jgi:hypothetical protein
MMRDLMTMFEYERKRRPDLAALSDDIANLSEDQIRATDLMPWMRVALLQLKSNHNSTILSDIIDQSVVDDTNPDPLGMMCQWNGGEAFIKVGRTSLLVGPGTLLWLTRNGMWIDTIFTKDIDPQLRGNITAKGEVTRSAYNIAVRDKRRKSIPEMSMPEPAERIRFFRPG